MRTGKRLTAPPSPIASHGSPPLEEWIPANSSVTRAHHIRKQRITSANSPPCRALRSKSNHAANILRSRNRANAQPDQASDREIRRCLALCAAESPLRVCRPFRGERRFPLRWLPVARGRASAEEFSCPVRHDQTILGKSSNQTDARESSLAFFVKKAAGETPAAFWIAKSSFAVTI